MTGLLLGLLLGMRHALEPDHLAAVSTMVARQKSPWSGALVGAYWGVGHSAALLGLGLLLAALHAELSPGLVNAFELCVAAMLIVLGARAMHRALVLGPRGPDAAHRHGAAEHRHAGTLGHVHLGRWTLARQPLLVGMIHGLAGSGALTALVLSSMPTAASRLLYLVLFGLGSVAGMTLLTGLAGWPLARLQRDPRAARVLGGATGMLSLGVGLWWGLPLVRGFLG
ncbi:MAG: hypothetical protein ACYC8T_01270 [Myxococcaceae bacterium]